MIHLGLIRYEHGILVALGTIRMGMLRVSLARDSLIAYFSRLVMSITGSTPSIGHCICLSA